MSEMSLRFLVANVVSKDAATNTAVLESGPEAERFMISHKTTFMGAVEDQVAFKSLQPGMSVNLWADSAFVVYASPNYK